MYDGHFMCNVEIIYFARKIYIYIIYPTLRIFFQRVKEIKTVVNVSGAIFVST